MESLRAPLERCGAIISRSLQMTAGQGHLHSSELVRWDQAYPGTGGTDANPSQALKDLLAAGVVSPFFEELAIDNTTQQLPLDIDRLARGRGTLQLSGVCAAH